MYFVKRQKRIRIRKSANRYVFRQTHATGNITRHAHLQENSRVVTHKGFSDVWTAADAVSDVSDAAIAIAVISSVRPSVTLVFHAWTVQCFLPGNAGILQISTVILLGRIECMRCGLLRSMIPASVSLSICPSRGRNVQKS